MKHLNEFIESYNRSISQGTDMVIPERLIELAKAIVKDYEERDLQIEKLIERGS